MVMRWGLGCGFVVMPGLGLESAFRRGLGLGVGFEVSVKVSKSRSRRYCAMLWDLGCVVLHTISVLSPAQLNGFHPSPHTPAAPSTLPYHTIGSDIPLGAMVVLPQLQAWLMVGFCATQNY